MGREVYGRHPKSGNILIMIFTELPLKGAWLITPEPSEDERGFFARTFDAEQMAARGMETGVVQTSIACNKKKGTLRGMHYQAAPHEEAKYVQCVRGAVYDVIIDLRPDSPTHKQWHGMELTQDNHRLLYVPKGIAHGYLTLTDGAELHYSMNVAFVPAASKGVRWNDPAFNITWPEKPKVISGKDAGYCSF